MLQDKINEIRPYFKSLESYNDALIVRVQFPSKWAVFPSDDGLIKPAPSDNAAHEFFYYGDVNKVSLEDIFDFIKNTIEVNESMEIKAKMLVEKVNELKKLFEEKSLDEIKTLQFTFDKPKKNKRKYARKKKTENNPQEISGDTKSTIDISNSTIEKFELAKSEKKGEK